jgi:[acyl-carrier-protein] S-malonyltransferase
MKVAFIFGPGGANEDPAGMISLYERNSEVRQAYDEVAGLSGIDVDVVLRKRDRQGDRNAALVNFISLAAGMLGIHDALCALGVSPSVIGGISLGGQVGSCVAGALPRPTLIDILQHGLHGPASDAPDLAETIAFAFVPTGQDHSWYYGRERDGVYVASDFGPEPFGAGRMLMLSGYRRALEDLAAIDRNHIHIREERYVRTAYHSPLHEHARYALSQRLKRVHFTDPKLPVCVALEGSTLTTAEERCGRCSCRTTWSRCGSNGWSAHSRRTARRSGSRSALRCART